MENSKTKKPALKTKAIVAVIVAAAAVILALVFTNVILPSVRYGQAEKLEEEGNLGAAAIAFNRLSGYKDSNIRSLALWDQVAQRETIALADDLVALKDDGTVVAIGYSNDEIGSWTDIMAVSVSNAHVVGLKTDGTVVAAGFNKTSDMQHHGRCDVEGWENIVSVVATGENTFGLKADGTVVAAGPNQYGQRNVSEWTDIVAIYPGGFYFTVGLKADGTVVATEFVPESDRYDMGSIDMGQNQVTHWKDIQKINALPFGTLGLKKDGTVVAAGSNMYGKSNVSEWNDIEDISGSNEFSLGLRADGTVAAAGNIDGISDWSGIVEISAGTRHIVALKKDGTVVAAGNNDFGQCEVQDWTDIVKVIAGDELTLGLKADGTLLIAGDADSFSAAAEWVGLKVEE